MPLSATKVLKRKKERLYVPLNFDNCLTIEAFVDLGAYVIAVPQNKLDRIKQQAPASSFEHDDSPNFQIQLANGQSEKSFETIALKLNIGDRAFAEYFVVMKNLTGSFISLHFMRHNRVFIDTTHGLIPFPKLTLQGKSTASETYAKPQAVLSGYSLTIPPMTTKTITAYVDNPSKWNKTGIVTPLGKITETATLLTYRTISTIIDKKVADRVNNTMESPYLIKKNTQLPNSP